MSYRTCVNDFQLFGNNESYPEWIEFIKSQDITIDDDGNYDGYITDVMGAIETLEKIVLNMEKEKQKRIAEYDFENYTDEQNRRFAPKSIFDLSNIYFNVSERSEDYFLLDELMQIKDNGYMFLPLTFINICQDSIVKTKHVEGSYRFYNYKLKKGCKIHVYAR